MLNTDDLIALADAYKAAAGISRDQTASYRIFGDSKKLSALRKGGDITVARFHVSIDWLRNNWPVGRDIPRGLCGDHPPANGPTPAPVQAPGRKGAA